MSPFKTQTPLERFLTETKEEIIRVWKQDVSMLKNALESLESGSGLPPIPSPIRGKDFVREPNVSALMRSAIEYQNALIPTGKEKYIEFPAGATNKKLNSDAKDALEVIMIECVGENYGSLSWATASKTIYYTECERFIQTAAASKDFLVFRQSSNYWSIRWLAEKKMKSKKRIPRTGAQITHEGSKHIAKEREIEHVPSNRGVSTSSRQTPCVPEQMPLKTREQYHEDIEVSNRAVRAEANNLLADLNETDNSRNRERSVLAGEDVPEPSSDMHQAEMRTMSHGSLGRNRNTKPVSAFRYSENQQTSGMASMQERPSVFLRLRVRNPCSSAIGN